MATELTATGRVILGMLALHSRSGYDIKQMVDRTTRHFWAASYGQIYPELRRLEEQGLVRGSPMPSGGRARMVYELTDAGRAALRDWLESSEEPVYEVRDESMLKLFFSDSAPGSRTGQLRAMRAVHERTLTQLRTIEELVGKAPPGPRLVWQLGIEFHQWLIDWCERQLANEEKEGGR